MRKRKQRKRLCACAESDPSLPCHTARLLVTRLQLYRLDRLPLYTVYRPTRCSPVRVDSKRFGSTRLVKKKQDNAYGHACNDVILVKQEQVWECISEDEKDDIVLLSVESQIILCTVESFFLFFFAYIINLWGCF